MLGVPLPWRFDLDRGLPLDALPGRRLDPHRLPKGGSFLPARVKDSSQKHGGGWILGLVQHRHPDSYRCVLEAPIEDSLYDQTADVQQRCAKERDLPHDADEREVGVVAHPVQVVADHRVFADSEREDVCPVARRIRDIRLEGKGSALVVGNPNAVHPDLGPAIDPVEEQLETLGAGPGGQREPGSVSSHAAQAAKSLH